MSEITDTETVLRNQYVIEYVRNPIYLLTDLEDNIVWIVPRHRLYYHKNISELPPSYLNRLKFLGQKSYTFQKWEKNKYRENIKRVK